MTQVSRHIIKLEGWDNHWIFNGLNLRQSYNDHHMFELSVMVPHPGRKKGSPQTPALTSQSLTQILGKEITLTIKAEGKNGASCIFKGFVDQVSPMWTSRACVLRIIGYSPEMFMDCGPRFRTFYQKSLSDIAQKIVGEYGSKLPPLNCNGAGAKIDFSVQTQETDYRFLCRLADNYGKVFYYDGRQMQFGDLEKKDSANAIKIAFGEDLKQAGLSLNTAPLNFLLGAYELEKSQLEYYRCVNECAGGGRLVSEVVQQSAVYPVSNIHLFNLTAGQTELSEKAKRLLAKQAHELVRISGVSDLPSLQIGSKINITNTPEIFGQGEYILIEVNHNVQNDHSYSNTFTAVPAGYPFPLRMQNARNPLCGPLMAIVKDHDDPKKLGRVRVQFIGDEEKTLSPWLRVLTPYTGFGGMYWLPEPGDQVVVQSEDFNIEKFPYVDGAFYHGKADAAQWHDPKNKKKGFTTEKVAFKIDDRSGKLTIEADDIEIIARKKLKTKGDTADHIAEQRMKIDGGSHLGISAARIDLNS